MNGKPFCYSLPSRYPFCYSRGEWPNTPACKSLIMVRLEGFEPPTCCSGGSPALPTHINIYPVFIAFLTFGVSAFARKLTPFSSI
jgi:hypothetical protein